MKKCGYQEQWNCVKPVHNTKSSYCLAHDVLFTWLVHGAGKTIDRIEQHDAVAGLPSDELRKVLKAEPWCDRIKTLVMDLH